MRALARLFLKKCIFTRGTHWPIESVGATIGRPPTWRSNAFSGKGFFTDKRAGASNARPYISCRAHMECAPSLSKNAVGAGLCSARGRLPCEKLSRKSVAMSGRRAEQSPAPTNQQQRRYSYPGVRWFFDSLRAHMECAPTVRRVSHGADNCRGRRLRRPAGGCP